MSIKPQYDSSIGADLIYDVNAPQETYLTTTNESEDQANAAVVRDVYNLIGYARHALQITGVNGADNSEAVTIWLSNDSDADDSADTGWLDKTTAITGGASVALGAGATTAVGYEFETAFKYMMVKKVYTTSGGDDNVVTEILNSIY